MYYYNIYDIYNNQLYYDSYNCNYSSYLNNSVIKNKYKISVSNERYWYNKFNEVKIFIDINDKLPCQNTDLGKWIRKQKQNYESNKIIMLNDFIRNEWEQFINVDKYKNLFNTHEEIWYIKFNELKEYIGLNNKLPTNRKTSLGNWLIDQINYYKSNEGIMSNETIRNEWERFMDDYKYKDIFIINDEEWYNNFNELKEYIYLIDKLPAEKTILGSWLIDQINYYKSNEGIMSNEIIRNEWENFINDDKYKDFFINYKEYWYNNLNVLKEYIELNGILPSDRKTGLGKWLNRQKENYKLNKGSVSLNKTIRNEWEKFITDDKYKDLFSNGFIWYIRINELKNYLDNNNKLPQKKTILDNWLKKQKFIYDLNKGIMNKNKNMRNEWENFINDDKYEKFFNKKKKWYKNFNELKEHIIINGKLPVESSILGTWLNAQINNYNLNKSNVITKNIMLVEDDIWFEWEKFINDDKYNYVFTNNN